MRESRFIIQKWIQNWSSDTQDTTEEREGARERQAWPKAMHCPPRVGAVGPTARTPLWSRVAHVSPMGIGDVAIFDWLVFGSLLESFKYDFLSLQT